MPIMPTVPEQPWWLFFFSGLAGGSLTAWIVGWIREWWNRPIIDAKFDRSKGCLVRSFAYYDDDESPSLPHMPTSKWARLLVRNSGRDPIQNSQAFVTSVRRISEGGVAGNSNEVLQLPWAHIGLAPRT